MRDVSPYMFGSNLPIYNPHSWIQQQTANISKLLDDGGVQFLRFPGGNPANQYLYDGSYAEHPFFNKCCSKYGASWMVSHGDFSGLCAKVTALEPLVQVNAALALVEGVENATAQAAGFIRAVEATQGVTVRHVEFGNENYGQWEVPFTQSPGSVNGTSYGNAFVGVVTALREQFPDIKFGFTALWNGTQGDTIPDFMRDLVSTTEALQTADFAVVHRYFFKQKGPTPPALDMLASAHELDDMADAFSAALKSYGASAADAQIPLAMTEYNIAQEGSSGDCAMGQHVSALWITEVVGNAMQGGRFRALNQFGFRNNYKACTSSAAASSSSASTDAVDESSKPGAASGGEETATASSGYDLVSRNDPRMPDDTPMPALAALAVLKRCVGDGVVNSSATGNVKAYASRFTDTEAIGLVLVNENGAPALVKVPLPPGLGRAAVPRDHAEEPAGATVSANMWVLEGVPSAAGEDPLTAVQTSFNGVKPTTPAGAPYGPLGFGGFAPYHATLTPGSHGFVLLQLPAASVVGVVAHQASPTEQ